MTSRVSDPDPVFLPVSGSGLEKIMDPDPVNIRPDPKPRQARKNYDNLDKERDRSIFP